MNTNEFLELEQYARKALLETRSNSKMNLRVVSGLKAPKACINIENKIIEIQIPDDWNPSKYDRIKRFASMTKIPLKKTLLEDITYHEVGHDKLKNDVNGLGVPQDMDSKAITLNGTIKGMLENNKFSQDGVLYLENVISDIINNTNGSNYTKFHGLSSFFAEQAELNNGKHSPLYEAFVKLNMELWGQKIQKAFAKPYYTNKKEIDTVVNDIVTELNLKDTKEVNIKKLFNKKNWEDTFYTFSKHLSKLMAENSPEMLPGSGSGGQGYEVPIEFDDSGEINPKNAKIGKKIGNDPILKKLLDKDNLKKLLVKANKDGMEAPIFVNDNMALDYLYQGLASEIYIKAESPVKGESMPIAPIQSRIFDHDKDNIESILFGKILFDNHGKPNLAVPRGHYEQVAKYKKSVKSYPELNIAIVDTSTSMLESTDGSDTGNKNIIPWGDNSKYHYAVLSYYGIEKALHRIGVGTKTKYNVITFDSKTESTGLREYVDDERKRRLLNPQFGNDTQIDMDVIKKQCRELGSILMTISDGSIGNWSSIKDQFKNVVKDKFYVHFQIGSQTQTSKDIESWGGVVIPIMNAYELPKKAIDITKTFYSNIANDKGGQ